MKCFPVLSLFPECSMGSIKLSVIRVAAGVKQHLACGSYTPAIEVHSSLFRMKPSKQTLIPNSLVIAWHSIIGLPEEYKSLVF